MGQYYYPVNLDTKEYIISHDFSKASKNIFFVGLKLMEHSYIGNPMMNVVERFLMPKGKWYKTRIVWAGDYADSEPDTKTKKFPEGENIHSIYGNVKKNKITIKELGKNMKDIPEEYRYLVNHSLKVFIDKSKIKKDEYGYKIHPLSLLTAEGNGRGGGDYHNDDDARIGFWSRQIISIEKEIPKGYSEMDGQFKE